MLLPEYRDPNAGRPDLTSAALSLTGVLAIIYGLKQIAQGGVSVAPLLFIGAGIGVGALFVRRQLTMHDPLIDLRLFRRRAFTASLATYGLSILVLFGGFLFIPQYLQLVVGLSPFQAGLWTLPWALAFVVGSMLTPQIVRRFRPAYVMCVGLLLATLGFGMFAMVDEQTSFSMFAAATSIFALGFSPVFTLTTDLVIGSAPPERAGAASAISETSAEFGGALGIAVFGSIGVAVYRRGLAGVLPSSLSADATEAARATLGGAMAAAEKLHDATGAGIAEAAREAFLQGLRICAVISVVGAFALAIFSFVMLRHVRPSGNSEEAAR